MGVIVYTFNLNISPKMSHGVLECDIVMLQNYAHDFVIKKGGVFCVGPCCICTKIAIFFTVCVFQVAPKFQSVWQGL